LPGDSLALSGGMFGRVCAALVLTVFWLAGSCDGTTLRANISLAVSPALPRYGVPVQFQALLNPPAASGTVTFLSDLGQPLCVASLTRGSGSCSSSVLGVGYHIVHGQYSGDATYASIEASVSFSVLRGLITMSTSWSISVPYGSNATFQGKFLDV
jgi:hypothetical protein